MKKIITGIAILVLTFAITGCTTSTLSEAYVEEEVIAQAQQVVEYLNGGDYKAVADMVREDLKEDLSADILENALGEKLDAAGAFQEYTQTVTAGQKDKSTGEEYAIVVAACQYENTKLTFTISMNEEMQLVGLYMK